MCFLLVAVFALIGPNKLVQAEETPALSNKETRVENMKERIKAVYEKVKVRIQIRIERLNGIILRVENLADKIAAKGKDVSQAKASLQDARASLAKATDFFKQADAKIQELSGSDDPQAILAEIRNLTKSANTEMKNCRAKIVEAVNSLKALK